VIEGFVLGADIGLAAAAGARCRSAFIVADHVLHARAGDAAIELAVIAVVDVAVGGDLRGRVRHVAVVQADGADDDAAHLGAGGLVGGATAGFAAFDVQALDVAGGHRAGIVAAVTAAAVIDVRRRPRRPRRLQRPRRPTAAGRGAGVGVDDHRRADVDVDAGNIDVVTAAACWSAAPGACGGGGGGVVQQVGGVGGQPVVHWA
jgi:hypothetical protein